MGIRRFEALSLCSAASFLFLFAGIFSVHWCKFLMTVCVPVGDMNQKTDTGLCVDFSISVSYLVN